LIPDTVQKLDPNYYGYLTVAGFRQVLDDAALGLSHLGAQEKDLIVAYCDVSDEGDGKIDYREFFRTFFKWHVKEEMRLKSKGTLKQVFIVTRHGTRFPLTPMPLNNSWPSHPDWWKSYGGKLTPKGIKEHTKIGEMLAERYMADLRLIVRPIRRHSLILFSLMMTRSLTRSSSSLATRIVRC
jgi:hypothetical protein